MDDDYGDDDGDDDDDDDDGHDDGGGGGGGGKKAGSMIDCILRIILGSFWKCQKFSEELDLGRRMTVDWPSSFK